MYICMYEYICIYIYVYMCICMDIYEFVYIYVYIFVNLTCGATLCGLLVLHVQCTFQNCVQYKHSFERWSFDSGWLSHHTNDSYGSCQTADGKDAFTCEAWLIGGWHDSFICVLTDCWWRDVFFCELDSFSHDMAHSCVWWQTADGMMCS